MAISGNTIVVGAEKATVGSNPSQGAAYIFERDLGGVGNWGFVKKLEAVGLDNLADYGRSCDIDGDVIAVGAPLGFDDGRVYLYHRDEGGPGNWGEVRQRTTDFVDGSASFGCAVAIQGDVLVVGAELLDEVRGTHENEILLFGRDVGGTNNWGQISKHYASDSGGNDHFGESVAIDGTTVVGGALFAEAGGAGRGAAYVFTQTGGAWTEVTHLTAADPQSFAYFGSSVAVLGTTVVCGSSGHSTSRGRGYRFDDGGAGFTQTEELTASNGAANHSLGYATVIGSEQILMSAPYFSGGVVYYFEGPVGALAAPAAGVRSSVPLLVRPNPIGANARFSWHAASPHAVVEVFDARGRLVRVIQANASGEASWSPDANVGSGVYFARVRGASGVGSATFTIQR